MKEHPEIPERRYRVERLEPQEVPVEVRLSIQRHMAARMAPHPRGHQIVIGEHRIRAFQNRVLARPIHETFHEFLIVLLKHTLGERWIRKQSSAQEQHQHAVMRWIMLWHQAALAALPEDGPPGKRVAIVPTGEVLALMVLADDLYRLQLVRKLPEQLLHRLRDRKYYQGARYEVAVASMFVRAGCDVRWIRTTSRRTCDFLATLRSGVVIAVEAKSRHRDGVLHERGAQHDHWTTELESLYHKGLRKDPEGHPLVVFLDVNRPLTVADSMREWEHDVVAMLMRRKAPTRESILAATNWSWHLDGSSEARPGEYLLTAPNPSTHPVAAGDLGDIRHAMHRYGESPTDE